MNTCRPFLFRDNLKYTLQVWILGCLSPYSLFYSQENKMNKGRDDVFAGKYESYANP
jgi:hypothetical protein